MCRTYYFRWKGMYKRNSAFKQNAWLTLLSPSWWHQSGAVRLTHFAFRTKVAPTFSRQGSRRLWYLPQLHGNTAAAIVLQSNLKFVLISRLLVTMNQKWYHVIIGFNHACVWIIGGTFPRVFSRQLTHIIMIELYTDSKLGPKPSSHSFPG